MQTLFEQLLANKEFITKKELTAFVIYASNADDNGFRDHYHWNKTTFILEDDKSGAEVIMYRHENKSDWGFKKLVQFDFLPHLLVTGEYQTQLRFESLVEELETYSSENADYHHCVDNDLGVSWATAAHAVCHTFQHAIASGDTEKIEKARENNQKFKAVVRDFTEQLKSFSNE